MNVSRIDKFVRERSRTASLGEAHALRQHDVELWIAQRASSMLVRSAVALALRCFAGSVYLRMDPGITVTLVEAAKAEGLAYGTPARVVPSSGPLEGGVLRIGLGRAMAADPFADAAGWVAGVNELVPSDEAANAPAAAFAVACVFGKLFAALLGAPPGVVGERWLFSLLSLSLALAPLQTTSRVTHPLSIGTITLIGAGAIGSAFAFVLRESSWSGHLRVVDAQAYDEPNHETTFLISVSDATQHRSKAKTLAALAGRSGLTTEPIEALVTRAHPVLESPCDVLVCAVDNPETRCILDDANCDLLLNAGVGGSHIDAGLVVWSRHDDGDGRLSSLYWRSAHDGGEPFESPPPPAELAGDSCSRIAYEGVALAAPFMALASAALLAAGAAQRALSEVPEPNYLQLDLLELQHKYAVKRRLA